MEVVAVVVALQALVFVVAFYVSLAVGPRAGLVAGLVIVLIWAFIWSVLAKVGRAPLPDLWPSDAFIIALLIGFPLYAGWALGVGAATWARSWAARRG